MIYIAIQTSVIVHRGTLYKIDRYIDYQFLPTGIASSVLIELLSLNYYQ